MRQAALAIPSHEIELRLMLGWSLTDEPHCSGAYMLPPETFHVEHPPQAAEQKRKARR